MDFICMNLIGEFHPPTSCGHCYALTAVCMLTGFTWCIPLKTKTAEEVSKAYLNHIYSNFGGSVKILMDNGTEFKNKLAKSLFFLCILPFLLLNLFKMLFALFAGSLVRVGSLRLFWGMVVRGCARRDLC